MIGGGIAGVQATLDIAAQGYQVCLVEKTPSIGGRMAMLDKTFPTLDCSACILTPKLSEVFRNPDVHLFTYSEVLNIRGKAGAFRVQIRKNPKFVHDDACSGCGECINACPIEIASEFDQRIGFKKAIYIPYPQALPNVPTIDMYHCIKCGRCQDACERDAIDFDMQEEIITLQVATIVIATGYRLFDVSRYPRLGYMHYSNVIHALEYERLINASGPTQGHIIRFSDGMIPRSIGFVQCVGARDVTKGVPYCSRVCCMYGIKNAVLAKEHNPETEVTIYYADMRAFGKGFEEFYQMARSRFGVEFIRGRVGEIHEDPNTKNLIVSVEDILNHSVLEREHDLIVLSPGIQPPKDIQYIIEGLHLDVDNEGYVMVGHSFLEAVNTTISGVLVCGCADGPKDIPDSVAAGSAAAMRASIIMAEGGS